MRPASVPGSMYGSSPRARGTQQRVVLPVGKLRFIPAGAGNTQALRMTRKGLPVHPRGRGEHSMRRSAPGLRAGSSPRARGTHRRVVALAVLWRFIPAGAGNTSSVVRRNLLNSVHPRGRGEHFEASSKIKTIRGSSPRARGTLECPRSSALWRRFIPAGAGNTIGSQPTGVPLPVHPRGRGEHYPAWGSGIDPAGSSPRARGTQGIGHSLICHFRFIPAGAGNTWRPTLRRPSWPVHPRGRGEHQLEDFRNIHQHGSSPRARGTRAPWKW